MSTEAVSLVSVKFGHTHGAVRQLYPSDPLPFPPPAGTVLATEALEFPNAVADRDRLDTGDVCQNPEVVHISKLVLETFVRTLKSSTSRS